MPEGGTEWTELVLTEDAELCALLAQLVTRQPSLHPIRASDVGPAQDSGPGFLSAGRHGE
jgi:hypothetical protein